MNESPSILDVLLKLVPTVVVLFSGLGGFLYWLLQRTVDTRLKERLEATKHELKLEQDKMSVVFPAQKESFRKILAAMHSALVAIEQRSGEGDDRLSIGREDIDKFRRVAFEETLMMDGGSDHAIALFARIMWIVVEDEGRMPTSDELSRAHNQMTLIEERLTEHFRIRVGLREAKPDPLLDVELLAAGYFINTFCLEDFNLPAGSPLRLRKNETAAELVSAAKKHRDELESQLRALKNAMQKRSSLFFEELTAIDRYLATLGRIKDA
jgi:hypothetical protein